MRVTPSACCCRYSLTSSCRDVRPNGGQKQHLCPPLPTPRLPSIPAPTSDHRTCRIPVHRLWPRRPLLQPFELSTHNPRPSKSETVCPLGINDLSYPLSGKGMWARWPRLTFHELFLLLHCFLPCCLVSTSRGWGVGGCDGQREEWGGKQKKAKKESCAGRERERDVKQGREIEPREDRLAASAALAEMSPLNGFPVLVAWTSLSDLHSPWEL